MASSSENPDPEVRKDEVWNRWVIFSPARAKRPSDFKSKSPTDPNPNQQCPFCIGHEHECAPEIFRVPPRDPDWKIRVIQNLYPALSRTLPEPQHAPSGSLQTGFGFHDVVIETPVHPVQLCDLPPPDIGRVFLAYTERIQQLASHKSIQYVQVLSREPHN